jgi:hypothetical protein
MILPDVVLPSRINQRWTNTGIDTVERCRDPELFRSYPYPVEYKYNSRGFRDDEWPDELDQAIWCMGDSFTVGVGSSRPHTWPWILQQRTGSRCINVSMDGASNNWIARQAAKILQHVAPQTMIIHWSYLHRREGLKHISNEVKTSFLWHYENVRAPEWPRVTDIEQFGLLPADIQQELMTQHDQNWRQGVQDEDLRLWHIGTDLQQDIDNTQQCLDLVESINDRTKIIHSFIPDFAVGHEQDFYNKLRTSHIVVPHFQPLDLARDGHHYDIKTCRYFVQQIQQVLNL